MKLNYKLAAIAFAAVINAQTAPDFYLTVEENLGVDYTQSQVQVTPPGVLLPRAQVLEAPSVLIPEDAEEGSQYVVFMIDQDVPRNNTRVPLLHWFQPNLYAGTDSDYLEFSASLPNGSTAVGASYIPPTPPAGSGVHRYTFVLFAQPANWAVPSQYATVNPPSGSSARVGFNITEFVAASGLAEPLAANYLRVVNGTAAETSSAATETSPGPTSAAGSASSAASSPAYTGGAVEVRGSGKDMVIGLGMAIAGAGLWMI